MNKIKKLAFALRFLRFATAEQKTPQPLSATKKPKRFFSSNSITIDEAKEETVPGSQRKSYRNPTIPPINPENFVKTINISEQAKNFNFKFDAEDESPRTAKNKGVLPTIESQSPIKKEENADITKPTSSIDLLDNENMEIGTKRKQKSQNDLKEEDQNQINGQLQGEPEKNLVEGQQAPEQEQDKPIEIKIESFQHINTLYDEWELIDDADLTRDLKYRNDRKYCDIKWIIFPDDKFMSFLDILVSLNLIYTALVIPFTISFVDDDNIIELIIFDFISTAIWAIDIFFNFFKAYEDKDDKLITSRKKIIIKYVTSWFILDVLSIFPTEYIFDLDKSFNTLVRIAKIPKLARFLRLTRLVRLLRFVKEGNKIAAYLDNWIKFSQGVDRFFVTILGFFIFCHIGACIWFFQASLNDGDPTSWINVGRDANIIDREPFVKYVSSLYYVIATTVTVGYGDIHAGNTIERSVAVFLMLFGAFVYSFIIGSLSSIILARDSKKRDLEAKLNTLIEIRQKYRLDSQTFNKIKKALKFGHNRDDNNGRTAFLNDLPLHLKTKLSLIMHKGMLSDIDFFKNRPPKFLANIGPYLKMMKITKFDYVCTEGEYANEIYFIKSGTIEIVLKEYNNFPFMQIEKGYFFGEIDILFGETRKHSYRAKIDCVLLSMNKKKFTKIFFHEFPEIGAEVYNNSLKRRVRQLKSYKEALNYCKAQAVEKGNKKEKFNPQTSSLFKGKLSIRQKDILENFINAPEVVHETEGENLQHPDEHNEGTNNQILSKDEVDLKKLEDQKDNLETAGIKQEEEEEKQKVQTLTEPKEIKPENEEKKTKVSFNNIAESSKALEDKTEKKSKGWSILRKELKNVASTQTMPNTSSVYRRGGVILAKEKKETQVEALSHKMEAFEKNLKQILEVYKSLGITEEELSRNNLNSTL